MPRPTRKTQQKSALDKLRAEIATHMDTIRQVAAKQMQPPEFWLAVECIMQAIGVAIDLQRTPDEIVTYPTQAESVPAYHASYPKAAKKESK